MSRSISYRKGTSSGFSTAINVRCRNEKINVSVSIHLDGLISITPYVFYMNLPIFIFQRIWSFSPFKCVSPMNVRWYLKYPLSYRNLKEMMIERGIQVDHSTIMRWVHQYSPEIEKKIERHLRPTNDSWRVDETYIKVKGKWKYFYRAVDSNGDTIDFMLSAKRNRKAAKRFFKKALSSDHNQIPRVITVDKN